jgi:hypothetical protein
MGHFGNLKLLAGLGKEGGDMPVNSLNLGLIRFFGVFGDIFLIVKEQLP